MEGSLVGEKGKVDSCQYLYSADLLNMEAQPMLLLGFPFSFGFQAQSPARHLSGWDMGSEVLCVCVYVFNGV